MKVNLLKPTEVVHQVFQDDGVFPNSWLPLLIYRNVIVPLKEKEAQTFEDIFESNGWSNSWRNGIFNYHHYHSKTHEVLGIYKGKAKVQLGGLQGQVFDVGSGDVIIIPAGVAHKNLGSSHDFACVGAYPDGRDFDMNYGKPGEREKALANIRTLPIPKKDPVFGSNGKLFEFWK